jgi:hypothetical protein
MGVGQVAGRRGNSGGSIYRRMSDGRWIGAATVDFGPQGRPKRRTVSARTRTEAVRKHNEPDGDDETAEVVKAVSMRSIPVPALAAWIDDRLLPVRVPRATLDDPD